MVNYVTRNSWLLLVVGILSVMSTLATWLLINRLNHMNELVDRTHVVIREGEKSLTCLMDCETAYRGYLITRDKSFLEPYEHCYRHVVGHIEQMDALTANIPAQRALLPELFKLAKEKIAFSQHAIAMRDSADPSLPAKDIINLNDGKKIMDQYRAVLDRLMDNEIAELTQRKQESEEAQSFVYASVFGVSLLILTLLLQTLSSTKSYAKEQLMARETLEGKVADRTRDLAESESRARLVFDLMPQLGFTAKADGSVDFYNNGWHEYTGKSFTELQGWGWESAHHPDYLPKVNEMWKHSIQHSTQFEMQFPLKKHDGTFRWFLTRVTPIFDEKRQVTGWVGINTDIDDERRDAEILEKQVDKRTRELQQARDEAIRANELKSQFVANISHEIRTPMSGILGLTELLTYETEGEINETAQHILSCAQNLMQVVNDLLDVSKLEAGRIEITKSPFKIDKLIDEVLTSFSVAAAQKKIVITRSIDKDVSNDLIGDSGKIRQVLTNLVQNAIKFTEAGSIIVSAQLQSQGQGQEFVRFTVTDTGLGISEENQKQLFQMFVQVDGSRTRKHGGTGLGLAISRRMVDLMGGAIGVDSQEEKGSQFWFTIPLGTEDISS